MVLLMVINDPLPGPAQASLSAEFTYAIFPIPYPIPLLVAGLNGIHLQAKGSLEKLKACITVSYCTTLMRSKNNELGQYAAGCVPRDPVYGKLLQEIRKKERQKP